MRNPLWLIAVALAVSPVYAADDGSCSPDKQIPPAALAAGGGVPGEFQSYLLALSWEPTFCESKPSAPECASQRPDRYDAKNLALHGLWPNKDCDETHAYGYCGVDASQRGKDHPDTWCALEPLGRLPGDELTTVMPGVASCLEHHEWARHGTCSGMKIDDYFALAASLDRRVADSAFGRFLTANAGQTVSRDAAVQAFEEDFGAGNGDKVVFDCKDVRGSAALSEVHLRLANPLKPAAELAAMLLPAPPVDKNEIRCPASFLLDPIPSR